MTGRVRTFAAAAAGAAEAVAPAPPARSPLPRPGMEAPNMARFYDAMLSGKDNFAAERDLAGQVTALAPEMPWLFRHNRDFVAGAVRRMAGRGIAQFVDLGCGLPTALNTHEIARERDPGARVIYVDRDPTVLVHGYALLADNAQTEVVDADVRDPAAFFRADRARCLLDPARPVGVLLTMVLPHVADAEDPHGLVRAYMDRLAPGSMLAVTHFHAPGHGEPLAGQARAVERALVGALGSGWFRSRAEIAAFFDGLVLDDGGLRPLPHRDRRPRVPYRGFPVPSLALAGLATKP